MKLFAYIGCVLTLLLSLACQHHQGSAPRTEMGMIETTSPPASNTTVKQQSSTQQLKMMIATLGEDLDVTSNRLAFAFKATNWRLSHEPKCLDTLFEKMAQLDTTYMTLDEAHTLSKKQVRDISSSHNTSETLRFKNQLRRLNEATHTLQQALHEYLQQTMSPHTSCDAA